MWKFPPKHHGFVEWGCLVWTGDGITHEAVNYSRVFWDFGSLEVSNVPFLMIISQNIGME